MTILLTSLPWALSAPKEEPPDAEPGLPTPHRLADADTNNPRR